MMRNHGMQLGTLLSAQLKWTTPENYLGPGNTATKATSKRRIHGNPIINLPFRDCEDPVLVILHFVWPGLFWPGLFQPGWSPLPKKNTVRTTRRRTSWSRTSGCRRRWSRCHWWTAALAESPGHDGLMDFNGMFSWDFNEVFMEFFHEVSIENLMINWINQEVFDGFGPPFFPIEMGIPVLRYTSSISNGVVAEALAGYGINLPPSTTLTVAFRSSSPQKNDPLLMTNLEYLAKSLDVL